MANIVIGCAKYLMIILVVIYTYQCFTVFAYENETEKKQIFRNQNMLMFMIHFMAFAGMYFKTGENKILTFYIAQTVILAAIILLYTKCYPKVNRLIVNNTCNRNLTRLLTDNNRNGVRIFRKPDCRTVTRTQFL